MACLDVGCSKLGVLTSRCIGPHEQGKNQVGPIESIDYAACLYLVRYACIDSVIRLLASRARYAERMPNESMYGLIQGTNRRFGALCSQDEKRVR